MSARLPLILAGAVLGCGAALAQSSVQVGLSGAPSVGAVAPGLAGVLSGSSVSSSASGPGGIAVAPGPAGSQTGGIQNLPSQAATTLNGGCTIPSPIFNIFSSVQPGTTTQAPSPLPLTNINGC